jgi:hypothetical protein
MSYLQEINTTVGYAGPVRITPAKELLERDMDDSRTKFNAWVKTMKGGSALVPTEFTRSNHWKHLSDEIKSAGYKLFYYDDECIHEKADRYEISW